jgi:hypothetical protein
MGGNRKASKRSRDVARHKTTRANNIDNNPGHVDVTGMVPDRAQNTRALSSRPAGLVDAGFCMRSFIMEIPSM